MFIEVESVKYLAPEGRHVYSTRGYPNVLKLGVGVCHDAYPWGDCSHVAPLGQKHIWDV